MRRRVIIRRSVKAHLRILHARGWTTDTITVASEKFAEDAERYVKTCKQSALVMLLTDAIDKIKSGKRVLNVLWSINDFIENRGLPPTN
ncbi:MAG: hypothetical protein Q8O88_06325 [bacterium]|nr:hypothetical protein [bacterium]